MELMPSSLSSWPTFFFSPDKASKWDLHMGNGPASSGWLGHSATNGSLFRNRRIYHRTNVYRPLFHLGWQQYNMGRPKVWQSRRAAIAVQSNKHRQHLTTWLSGTFGLVHWKNGNRLGPADSDGYILAPKKEDHCPLKQTIICPHNTQYRGGIVDSNFIPNLSLSGTGRTAAAPWLTSIQKPNRSWFTWHRKR
jgi:hypothetical protein